MNHIVTIYWPFINHLLVGGLVAIFYFSHILGIIIPIDFHIFQRGGPTTNQFMTVATAGDRFAGCNFEILMMDAGTSARWRGIRCLAMVTRNIRKYEELFSKRERMYIDICIYIYSINRMLKLVCLHQISSMYHAFHVYICGMFHCYLWTCVERLGRYLVGAMNRWSHGGTQARWMVCLWDTPWRWMIWS